MRDLRVRPQGRHPEPRAGAAGAGLASEDAPPRRQRRRRGRRLRPAGRHPDQDLGRGGPPGRPQPLAGPRRRLRGRPRLRRALGRPRQGPPRRARDPGRSRLPHPRRAGRRGRLGGARSDRARGGAALLAVRRTRPRGGRRRLGLLQAEDRARGQARRPRRLLQRHHLRLQGDGRAQGAGGLLPRPHRRALRDDRLLRAQPLLDQHLALVHARPALRRTRTQRRDQHDRAAAPGGAHARDPDRRGQLRLPGPEPRDRDAVPPRRPLAGRGDGDGGAADRRRDRGPARGAALVLHVRAPADGAVRAGTRWR